MQPHQRKRPDVANLCATRLGFELCEHMHRLARAGKLPEGSRGYRARDRTFTVVYGREPHRVDVSVVRAYVQALREGFDGRHDALD